MMPAEMAEMKTAARNRSNIYGFLAAVYRQEMTPELLEKIKTTGLPEVLSGLGLNLDSTFLQQPESRLLEELAVEYTRLFLGPGPHISPHESVQREDADGPKGRLWGEATVAVKKFVEGAGFSYREAYKGMPDHIGVELEFMQFVTAREAEAWEQADEDSARRCRAMEKRFLQDHLLRWVPPFCRKIMAGAELDFYREMAALTDRFMRFEDEEMRNDGVVST